MFCPNKHFVLNLLCIWILTPTGSSRDVIDYHHFRYRSVSLSTFVVIIKHVFRMSRESRSIVASTKPQYIVLFFLCVKFDLMLSLGYWTRLMLSCLPQGPGEDQNSGRCVRNGRGGGGGGGGGGGRGGKTGGMGRSYTQPFTFITTKVLH